MLAYSPMFTPLSAYDDSSLYYNGLQQEFNTQNQYLPPFHDYDGINLHSSFDDQFIIPPPTSPLFYPPPLPNPLDAEVVAVAEKEDVVHEKKKKQDHNASERIRRMKINGLYSSLRSLLPSTDQTKKLSIPVTVGRAIKYIPELQNQVQELIEKKEKLLPRATTSVFSQAYINKTSISSSSSVMPISVEAIQLGNGEISIQISALKSNAIVVPVSEVLRELEEEDDVVVVDVSSSESSVGRVFHRIHLMVRWINTRDDMRVIEGEGVVFVPEMGEPLPPLD
ncbi:hypothetical protein V2J09_023988 [Rumex salicifolius]